jgi:hypothetical protein
MHLAVQFAQPDPRNLVLVGFNLGGGYFAQLPSTKQFFDFSQVNSLKFRAKGSGSVVLQFATKATKDADGWGHFQSPPQVLGAGWQEFTVDLATLVAPAGSQADSVGTTWDQVRQQTYAIDFMFTQATEFYLEEVKLVGAGILDL